MTYPSWCEYHFFRSQKNEKFRRERGAGNHVRLQNRLKMKTKKHDQSMSYKTVTKAVRKR